MSIRRGVSAAALFVLGLCPFAHAERRQASPLALTVVAPRADEGDSSVDLNQDDSHMDVILENVSRHPLKIWRGDSFFYGLTLEVIALDGKSFPARVTLVPLGFSQVGGDLFPTFTIEPGQKIIHEVHLRNLVPYVNGNIQSPYINDSIQKGTIPTANALSSLPGLFPVTAKGATQETATIRAVFHETDPSFPGGSARKQGVRKDGVWTGQAVSAATDVLIFLRPTDSAQAPLSPTSSPSPAVAGPNKFVKK